MPKFTLASAVSALLAVSGTAAAQEQPQAAFNLGVATDYVFRGLDQSDRRGQVYGSADVDYREGYAGIFTSNVNLSRLGDPRASQEVDVYGGWRPQFRGYDLDFGMIYYGFLDQTHGARDDFAEASARIGRSFGPVSGALSVHYSPEYRGHLGEAWYSDATASYAFTPSLSASALIGRQTIARAGDYTTWNLGGTWSFAPHLALDLRYWDRDAHGFGEPYGSKLVASLKANF
jgi:uncharacterized protein (TIGR02001 family)